MAVVWDTNLPQTPQWREYQEDQQENTIRTDLDAGPAKVRLRYTAISEFYNIKLNLTSSQVDIMKDFYNNDCSYGTVVFEWKNFRTGTLGVEYRFLSKPSFKAASPTDYECIFKLEKLP